MQTANLGLSNKKLESFFNKNYFEIWGGNMFLFIENAMAGETVSGDYKQKHDAYRNQFGQNNQIKNEPLIDFGPHCNTQK